MNTLRLAKINIQTTLVGLGMIVVAVTTFAIAHFDGDPSTVANSSLMITEILAGVGLIFARDANKSSEGEKLK